MKGLFVVLLVFGLTCSCSTRPDEEAYTNPHAFVYQGEFYPSFMPSCMFSLTADKGAGRLKWTVYTDRDTLRTTAFADSAALSPNDVRTFLAAFDSVPLFRMKSKQQSGTDGITVHNIVSKSGLHNEFTFWSPRKFRDPQEHQLVEAVLGLARRKFTSLKQQEYFESLEQYFDFGLPCRVTSTKPFEVRMYGSLSSSEEAALTQFVHDLPTDKPLLLEMTNFQGMGTMFYPLFQGLLKRNPNVVWVASPKTYAFTQLQEMGVPSSRIDTTTAAGRNRIKTLSAAQK